MTDRQTDRQTELLQQVHRYAVLTPLRAANERQECWPSTNAEEYCRHTTRHVVAINEHEDCPTTVPRWP